MKSDVQIQQDVMDELKWDPVLIAAEIGVAVKDGVVTLGGQVSTYAQKLAAERDAKKVAGVKAVAEDIQVGISPVYRKTDSEIAEAVVHALKWHVAVQEEKIKIKVEDGRVQLDGEVDWEYQRDNAQAAIQHLAGVRSVLNLITVKPRATTAGVQQKIRDAFERSATVDADRIGIDVSGSKVTLHGKVRSFAEKEDAEQAAWKAPGVASVDNELEIDLVEFAFD